MVIEHVAFQHPAPADAARWYARHLDFLTVRFSAGASEARFLADSAGRTVLELYNNAAAPMPDYPTQSPLTLHIAFASADPQADSDRLVAGGATLVEAPLPNSSGDILCMLRDPWGVPLQLVHRVKPLLGF